MTSLLIAREGGPPPERLTAPQRAKWAAHFERYPPLPVAVGKAAALVLRALGVKEESIAKALPWAVIPTIDQPEKTVAPAAKMTAAQTADILKGSR